MNTCCYKKEREGGLEEMNCGCGEGRKGVKWEVGFDMGLLQFYHKLSWKRDLSIHNGGAIVVQRKTQWHYDSFDGDTCEENEFRAFVGCARIMNARERRCDLGVVGMVILAKNEGHDVDFLREMEFRDRGLSFHGGDVRGFMVAARLGFSAMRFRSSEIGNFFGFCCDREEEDDVNGVLTRPESCFRFSISF
ncbi:hypothetical protein V8G54_017192 [Vigna mungo]|uniref:Uncharacterized protein n=1 Tax=Vigna mungo TaxID=3915 RepID=A0AAQ3S018_VIGMU